MTFRPILNSFGSPSASDPEAIIVVFNEATRETTGEIAQLREEFARFSPFLPIAMQQLSSHRRV